MSPSTVHYACGVCASENVSTQAEPRCGGCGAAHVRDGLSGIRVLDPAARVTLGAQLKTLAAKVAAVAEVKMSGNAAPVAPVVSKKNFIVKGLYGVGGVLLVGVGTALTGIQVVVPNDMNPLVANGIILAAGFIGGGVAGIIKRAGESLLGKR